MLDPIRERVLNRAGNRCEKCGRFLRRNRRGKPERLDGRSFHHRQKQSEGGRDSVFCLVALCLRCHRDIHADEEAASLDGWIVRRNVQIAPFLGWRGWVLPTLHGGLVVWDFTGGRTTELQPPQPRSRPVRRSTRPPRKTRRVA